MKKVLLTGHSGFLGSYIGDFLDCKGIKVYTLGRSEHSDIVADLSIKPPAKLETFDIVVHAAGKAHEIPRTKAGRAEFFSINFKGTQNLLIGLKTPPKTIIFISSVAVYGLEFGENIDENQPLNGTSEYARSKILAENEIIDYCKKTGTDYVILRLPLIFGDNPPGNLGAMIKAIKKGYYFRIGEGDSRKSIVAASDVAKLIPRLQGQNGIYNLTDRRHPTFKEIENHFAGLHGGTIKSLPIALFKFLAKIGDTIPFFNFDSKKLNKMTKSLTFSDERAVQQLNWNPSSIFQSNN